MPKENSKKIFIVDDDVFILDMYAMKFKAEGFEVETATNGEDALEKIRKGIETDILLFDLIMPGVDGYDLIKTIKSENLIPDAVKIVLSNQGQKEDLEKIKEFDVSGYLIKAMTVPSEVVEEVKKIYLKNKK